MLKSLLVSAVLCLIFLQVNAQSLYLPRDLKKPIKIKPDQWMASQAANTGKNTAHYNIAITVMPPDKNGKGTASRSSISITALIR